MPIPGTNIGHTGALDASKIANLVDSFSRSYADEPDNFGKIIFEYLDAAGKVGRVLTFAERDSLAERLREKYPPLKEYLVAGV